MNKLLRNLISWFGRHLILTAVLIVFGFLFLIGAIYTPDIPNQGIGEPIPSYHPTRSSTTIPKTPASVFHNDPNPVLEITNLILTGWEKSYGERCIGLTIKNIGKNKIYSLEIDPVVINNSSQEFHSAKDTISELLPSQSKIYDTKHCFSNYLNPQIKELVIAGTTLNPETTGSNDYFNSIKPLPYITAGKSIKSSSPTLAPTPTPINYSSFQSMHVEDYAKNPPLYYGKPVKIRSAFVKDFLAKGDRGGDTNRIDVLDRYSQVVVPTEMIFNINDNNLYQKAVSLLNKSDYINVYGIGEKSSDATGSLTGSQTFPVLKVLRIDKCDMSADIICETGSIETIFSQ